MPHGRVHVEAPLNANDLLATAQLRAIMRHAADLAQLAGNESVARHLRETPVRLASRLACAFRSLRTSEPALLVTWGVATMGPSPRGLAVEALHLARAACLAALAHVDRDTPWLGQVERRLADELRGLGFDRSAIASVPDLLERPDE